jgi:hypothetical protein
MKESKLMEERIRRVKVLFKELGFRFFNTETQGTLFTSGFEDKEGFQGEVIIDRKCRFLEISFTFFFSLEMADFLKQRLEEMLKLCYEFGCYIILSDADKDLGFSVFTKLYYTGLNFYSLKQSVEDFRECVEGLTNLLKISSD